MRLATAFKQQGFATVSQYSAYFHNKVTYAFPKEEFCLPSFVAVKNEQGTYDVMKVKLEFVKRVKGDEGEVLEETLGMLAGGNKIQRVAA